MSSITGTTISAVARCSSTSSSTLVGSNLFVSTTVDPSSIDSVRCPSPQAWNTGQAITVGSPACSGIRDSIATTSSIEAPERAAPRGAPRRPDPQEKIREDRIRALGWHVVRWTWQDLEDPKELAERIRRALAYGASMSCA